ncbi:MAG: YIP1 family protein [Acidobacteriota bacterium]|nr:YIP1 family protein [Acidobacteriota bacterium]
MSESESLYGANENREAPPKPIGLMDQFIGVFTEPVATFKKLQAAPSWVGALVVLILTSLVVAAVWGFKVDVDAMLRPGFEANPKMTPEIIDQTLSFMEKFFPYIAIVQTLIIIPIVVFFMALIYWLIGKAAAEGEKPSYVHALSATVVPSLVMVPHSFLILVMAFLRPVGGLTPEKLTPSSVGFFVTVANPKLHALLYALDPFTLGSLALGFLAFRHTMRMKTGGALACTLLAVLFTLGFRILGAK